MNYSDFGLVNTREIFRDAIRRRYAVPAFNFYNMETLNAIMSAARETNSPVILAVSESAMKYMGADMLMGMVSGLKLRPQYGVALHLDHGHSLDACRMAIEIGFSSVMIDASAMSYDENVELTRHVVDIAHPHDVVVEAELGVLSGIEDENTQSTESNYTNPDDVVRFVSDTNIDSLAIAIGTSHGAYKCKTENAELRFDILAEIARRLPDFPLVLHGASSIPQHFVKTINENGGELGDARGIAPSQLRRATEMNICKINVDSDSRMAFTAGVREYLQTHPANFNPRDWIGAGMKLIAENCAAEIKSIMGSDGKL
ncbi:MAG: ketose-bisphosphate aldolase [Alphaproteobacteria bacterium]|nr:ketose-bisphosphate aldolase [Alphaproteobacteria bacterium]